VARGTTAGTERTRKLVSQPGGTRDDADRAWRASFAEYIEKRAAEVEQLLACVEKCAAH
jgi:hypothetical protein